MNIKSCKVGFAAAVLFLAISGTAQAQIAPHEGCSNAALNGDYGFTVQGSSIGVLVPNGAPPVRPFSTPMLANGVAMANFDGKGNVTQIDFVMHGGISAGVNPGTPLTPNGFRTNEKGTYNVASDCSGTFSIKFEDTSEIDVVFVLADHGRQIHTVVARQHVPALPPAALPAGVKCDSTTNGCDLAVQISSDGVKLGFVLNGNLEW